ncbi:hypothetical protein LXL04_008012 [Taraxacum kok-saghyz]
MEMTGDDEVVKPDNKGKSTEGEERNPPKITIEECVVGPPKVKPPLEQKNGDTMFGDDETPEEIRQRRQAEEELGSQTTQRVH